MVAFVKKLRYAILVNQFFHTERKFLPVAHLACLVEHPDHELLVVRGGHHCAIHVLFIFLEFGQPRIALVIEFSHP